MLSTAENRCGQRLFMESVKNIAALPYKHTLYKWCWRQSMALGHAHSSLLGRRRRQKFEGRQRVVRVFSELYWMQLSRKMSCSQSFLRNKCILETLLLPPLRCLKRWRTNSGDAGMCKWRGYVLFWSRTSSTGTSSLIYNEFETHLGTLSKAQPYGYMQC